MTTTTERSTATEKLRVRTPFQRRMENRRTLREKGYLFVNHTTDPKPLPPIPGGWDGGTAWPQHLLDVARWNEREEKRAKEREKPEKVRPKDGEEMYLVLQDSGVIAASHRLGKGHLHDLIGVSDPEAGPNYEPPTRKPDDDEIDARQYDTTVSNKLWPPLGWLYKPMLVWVDADRHPELVTLIGLPADARLPYHPVTGNRGVILGEAICIPSNDSSQGYAAGYFYKKKDAAHWTSRYAIERPAEMQRRIEASVQERQEAARLAFEKDQQKKALEESRKKAKLEANPMYKLEQLRLDYEQLKARLGFAVKRGDEDQKATLEAELRELLEKIESPK